MCVGWWWSWFIVLLDEPVGISDRLQSFPGYFIYLAQLFGISEQLNFCLSFRQRFRMVYLTFLLVHLYTMEFTANVKLISNQRKSREIFWQRIRECLLYSSIGDNGLHWHNFVQIISWLLFDAILFLVSKQQFQLFVKITHDFTILNDAELIVFSKCFFYRLLMRHTSCIWQYSLDNPPQ